MPTPLPPIEKHPLKPFLPAEARLLMLGSFPPKRERWSMEFFYPNRINDMWRIMGLIFFGDKHHFESLTEKRFDKERIIDFCAHLGLALYDTALEVRRLKDNASDAFLDVVTPTDLHALLRKIPHCRFIVTTGEKATEVVCQEFRCAKPSVGESTAFIFDDRSMRLWRMPSSSRAYPLPLDRKADYYRRMFLFEGLL